jgi:predicted Zn-ribbon and HTH transcriptional regulator
MDSNLIVTCPVCGYSFKNPELTSEKKKFKCPMCRSNFIDSNNLSPKFDDFTI